MATLLCDRKAYSQTVAPINNYSLLGDRDLYFNIESGDIPQYGNRWDSLYSLWADKGEPVKWDIWQRLSNTYQAPQYDQDQRRLSPIIIGRNMAIDVAQAGDYTHLFFVDADVVVPADSIPKLLELKKPIAGGVVHGRGAHSAATYIMGPRFSHRENGVPLVVCDHGTMGFCMIERRVFERLRFRSGPSWKDPKIGLSEDPAYIEDAEKLGLTKGMTIRIDLEAKHVDDPEHPLTLEVAVNNYVTEDHT